MKAIRRLTLLALLLTVTAFAAVTDSVIPLMEQIQTAGIPTDQLCADQQLSIGQLRAIQVNKLRVVTFNMLYNLRDYKLDEPNRWPQRGYRVVEMVQHLDADLIGSQELQYDQLSQVARGISDDYGYVGENRDLSSIKGEINTIFYRKDRLELLESEFIYYPQLPDIKYERTDSMVWGLFRDKRTGQRLLLLNTHLAFKPVLARQHQTQWLADYLKDKTPNVPVIVTGDFNTFPFHAGSPFPAYDGDMVIKILESSGLSDATHAVVGHFGPLSSTNYSLKERRSFVDQGTPGVILDHIFVSDGIKVLSHACEPAKVDDRFPSDHFPVIADLVIP